MDSCIAYSTDDAAEGRVKHHRSSRMDPRKLLLLIAIMACVAAVGILYYRIAQRGPLSPLDREAAEVGVSQQDVELLYLWHRYTRLEDVDSEKDELLKEIKVIVLHRKHLDASFDTISLLLFGPRRAANLVRSRGLPLVDDGDCFKSMVRIFERHCGSLGEYGLKHMKAFADICNNNVSYHKMEKACFATCGPPIANFKDYSL